LYKQTYPNFHLQLMDNASAPGFVEEVAEAFPALDIKALKENLGYTGGNNLALKQALAEGYDYVVIANHDIELDENALKCLVETAENHPDAGLVGGVEICYFTGQVRVAGLQGHSLWFSRPIALNQGEKKSETILPCFVANGCLLLLTRKALEANVQWDDRMFMYIDEQDLGFNLQKKGFKAYIDHRVQIRHKNQIKRFSIRSGYLQQRNRAYIIRKHGRWYHQVAYLAYATLVELPVKLIIRTLQGHIRFAQACLLGHMDGIAGRMGKGRLNRL
jgi:GT2 family glycosyltransferase